MKNNIKSFTISAILASSLGVLAVSIPNSFTAGQPIKAADVNANFSSLKAAVDTLEAAPKITVPFSLTGAGVGLGNATLQASNSNSGIAALISQSKTGASDGALVIVQSGTGPILKGFGSNGGNEEFRVDSDGTVTAKSFTPLSDRNRKTNFSSVNGLEVLAKVARLPIQRWNYKDDAANLRHIGPMAQDFYAAFGLNGTDNKHISLVDGQGVALSAIQGLNQKLEQRNAKIKQLESKLATFEARLAALERK